MKPRGQPKKRPEPVSVALSPEEIALVRSLVAMFGAAWGESAVFDVALTLALLSAFASIAFVKFAMHLDDAAEGEAAKRVYDGMIAHAHRMQGSCTGEHGIGLGKRKQLIAEFGDDVVDLMRELKRAMDPKGILNPGKIFERLT